MYCLCVAYCLQCLISCNFCASAETARRHSFCVLWNAQVPSHLFRGMCILAHDDCVNCPVCVAPLSTVDIDCLFRFCLRLRASRGGIFMSAELSAHPAHICRPLFTDDKFVKLLLQFLHEKGLHAFI